MSDAPGWIGRNFEEGRWWLLIWSGGDPEEEEDGGSGGGRERMDGTSLLKTRVRLFK